MGELVPKSLGLRNPFYFARLAAPWFSLFGKVLGPVVTLLEWCTKIVLRVFFWKHTQPKAEDEERRKDSMRLDSLSPQTRQYMLNLAGVEKKTVQQIFVPWSSVNTADVSVSLEAVEDIIVSSGHTRVPVVDKGKVVGILNTKEFMALRKSGSGNWTSIIRPHIAFQTYASLMSALRTLQDKKNHMAIIFEGETVRGIVTMEDILEEIVGDIFDEDDDGAIRRILSSGGTLRAPYPRTQL